MTTQALLRCCSLAIVLLVIPSIGSARKPAGDAFLPLSEGDVVEGGYHICEYGISDEYAQRLWINGQEGRFEILFTRRDDSRPFFAQTEHCNITYSSLKSQEGMVTPESLELALTDLQQRAQAQDLRCTASAVYVRPEVTEPFHGVPAVLDGPGLPIFLFVLLAALAFSAGWTRTPSRYRTASFWVAIAALTILAALIRLHGADWPFCESASTQRIQIGASPFWDLLGGRVPDYRHPPMTTWILHGVLAFGRDEALLRLPFAVASAASIPVVGWLSKQLSGRVAGIGAAALCAVLISHVAQGRDIGSHALFHLALPLVAALHLAMRRNPSRKGAVLLGVAAGLAMWAHFLAFFLLAALVLDALAMAPKRHRRRLWLATGVGAAIGALPLIGLVRGFARDYEFRQIATTAPSAVWGEKTAGSVLAEAAAAIDASVAIVLFVMAFLGTLLLLRVRCRGESDEPAPSLLMITAWAIPLAVLAATPLQRMRGIYATLSVPLLAVLAMHAATAGPKALTDLLVSDSESKGLRLSRRVTAQVLVLLVIGLAALAGWRGFPPAILRHPCSADVETVAQHVRSTEQRHVALIYGHSATLLGFYLSDIVVAEREAEQSPYLSVYHDYSIHNLAPPNELSIEWRHDAEKTLAALVRDHGEVMLLSFDMAESAWPELIEAGHCTPDRLFPGIESFLCTPPGDV